MEAKQVARKSVNALQMGVALGTRWGLAARRYARRRLLPRAHDWLSALGSARWVPNVGHHGRNATKIEREHRMRTTLHVVITTALLSVSLIATTHASPLS